MKSLLEIRALYEEIDGAFDSKRESAVATGDEVAPQRFEQKQLLNDQAYFVLCWGQLEAEIDEACRAAIRDRQASRRWEMRRGFDFYNPDDKRLSGLPFDRRVGMVLDRGDKVGGAYAKVMAYYETRNRIAHGRLQATRIDVSQVVADFYTIQAHLWKISR